MAGSTFDSLIQAVEALEKNESIYLKGRPRDFLPHWITMELHRKSMLSFFHGYRTQAPDQEGILLKKGTRNLSYQRRWFILQGNLLFYLEHQTDHAPLGLIPLENCQVELHLKATEPYAFTILTPGVGGPSSWLQKPRKSWRLGCGHWLV
ncbi:sesquipedalian-1-like [Rhinopithecus roxellana]|uniref:sesquipedalian-1-like n=1 Tax=Rhinopithecus roxellana TaxID=61622 RepID=UPI00053314FF|nr:sesquipedalian-1-like [Rhinopithecus roxellana]XP_017736900.1 PREDICTED: sesquipedalian-1-like isoform X1 [Rhinopithecus bieti]